MGLNGLMSGLGMDIFAIVALVLFLASFVAVLVWTVTRPRKEIETYANLPLQDDEA